MRPTPAAHAQRQREPSARILSKSRRVTPYELVDWSGPCARGDAAWGAVLGAFLRRTRRLPARMGTHVGHTAMSHRLSSRAPARPEAAALVRALTGRLGVLSQGAATVIPAPAASLAWALARTALGGPGVGTATSAGDVRDAAERRRLDEFLGAGGAARGGLAWCAATLGEAPSGPSAWVSGRKAAARRSSPRARTG
jgi:hypothetical protein